MKSRIQSFGTSDTQRRLSALRALPAQVLSPWRHYDHAMWAALKEALEAGNLERGRGEQNFEINPMDHSQATRLQNLRQAPRCGARTRGGTPCKRPALRGRKRCRLHGALSPGAPRGPKNGNFKNGDWTAEAIEERKWLRSLVQSFAKTHGAAR